VGVHVVILEVVCRTNDTLVAEHEATALATSDGRTRRDFGAWPDVADTFFVTAVKAQIVACDANNMVAMVHQGHHQAAKNTGVNHLLGQRVEDVIEVKGLQRSRANATQCHQHGLALYHFGSALFEVLVRIAGHIANDAFEDNQFATTTYNSATSAARPRLRSDRGANI
jgi:hypothetical protein